MTNQVARDIGLAGILTSFVLITIYQVASHWLDLPLGLLLVAILCVQVAVFAGTPSPEHEPQEGGKCEKPMVDPWELQKSLMAASGQDLPQSPTLNNGTLLYAALIMEELGETFEALATALHNVSGEQLMPIGGSKDISAVMVVQLILLDKAGGLKHASLRVRDLLQDFNVNQPLRHEDAVEILDGTTDLAVVNAGFALAAGLPGPLAYLEVVSSNLSKANPMTGVIDKTVDGKWIKGPDYFKPDLAKVLEAANSQV